MTVLKRLRGAHLPEHKNTQGSPSSKMPAPKSIVIPMAQHIGAPCEPLVAVGDSVKVGQKIGDSDAYISAPIHSSVSGTVTAISDFRLSTNGDMVKAVSIESDGEQTLYEGITPPVVNNHSDFVAAIRESGAVGLGGAGFPTHVKFNPKNLSEIDTIIINAAECEPYITSDNQTILENTKGLLKGIAVSMKLLNVNRCVIGIEENKPEAIALLQGLAKENNFEVSVLSTLYPKGAEKVLIHETVGRVIPEDKLPADIGVLVFNVATIAFIGGYLHDGIPLIKRRVTVDGAAVKNPQNVMVPVGSSINSLLEFTGGFKENPSKITMGGPMMGFSVSRGNLPMLKQNNAIIAYGTNEETSFEETPCIRCGDCMRACPISLMPFSMKTYTTKKDIEQLAKLKVNLCIECGCCSYVCPANQELVQSHKNGKKLLAANKK